MSLTLSTSSFRSRKSRDSSILAVILLHDFQAETVPVDLEHYTKARDIKGQKKPKEAELVLQVLR